MVQGLFNWLNDLVPVVGSVPPLTTPFPGTWFAQDGWGCYFPVVYWSASEALTLVYVSSILAGEALVR